LGISRPSAGHKLKFCVLLTSLNFTASAAELQSEYRILFIAYYKVLSYILNVLFLHF